jgi:hypothetical protein
MDKITPTSEKDGLPQYDSHIWESGMQLMADLVREKLQEPCWIKYGASCYKINQGESAIMARAMMLFYDIENQE